MKSEDYAFKSAMSEQNINMMNETGDAMMYVDPSPFQQVHLHQNCHHCHHIAGYCKARQWLDTLIFVDLRSTELCENC